MKWFRELLVVFYPPEVPNHHTLKAWQHAERLAVECSRVAQRFPDFEQERLADQLRRASYSIPLNIARICPQGHQGLPKVSRYGMGLPRRSANRTRHGA